MEWRNITVFEWLDQGREAPKGPDQKILGKTKKQNQKKKKENTQDDGHI